MLKIQSLEFDNWAFMAPMAGITNLPFRRIVKKMGAGLVTTEMVSAMGLVMGQEKTLRYLAHHEDEGLLSVQIFGADPETMGDAAHIAETVSADIIDINMGCPAKKVIKTGAGGALLLDIKKIYKIIRAVRNKCMLPITVKIRAGWSSDMYVAEKVACVAQDAGANAITVHPRYVKQKFSGSADWSIIKKVKQAVSIPVIGNGNIHTPYDAFRMKDLTGCDAIMIGRAAVGSPWIFRQINDIRKGHPPFKPSLNDLKALITEHFHLLSSEIGEQKAARIMRGFLIRYTKGLPFSAKFRRQITKIKNFDNLVAIFEEHFCPMPINKSIF